MDLCFFDYNVVFTVTDIRNVSPAKIPGLNPKLFNAKLAPEVDKVMNVTCVSGQYYSEYGA